MKAFTIFISYAHQDEAFKDQLTQQLKGLQRQGLIAPWHDRCIDGGDDCKRSTLPPSLTRRSGVSLRR